MRPNFLIGRCHGVISSGDQYKLIFRDHIQKGLYSCAQRNLPHPLLFALYIDNMSSPSQTPVAVSPPDVIDLVDKENFPIVKKEVDREWLKERAVVGMGITIENLNKDVQSLNDKFKEVKDHFKLFNDTFKELKGHSISKFDNTSSSSQMSVAVSPPDVIDMVDKENVPIVKKEVDTECLRAIGGVGITTETLDEDVQRLSDKFNEVRGHFKLLNDKFNELKGFFFTGDVTTL